MPLWHYTCARGRKGIGLSGFIVPNVGLAGELVWLTDMDQPDRLALGLTSHLLSCDRLAFRYEVARPLDVAPWLTSRARAGAPALAVIMLESVLGADPRRWYVSPARQFGRLDRRYRRPA